MFKGTVGTVRTNQVGNKKVANFSVATEYVYKDKNDEWVSETTWLPVTVWQSNQVCDLDLLVKGAKVFGTGRLRSRKYTDQQGQDREVLEVLADSVDVIMDKPQTTAKPAQNTASAGVSYQSQGHTQQNDDMPF